MEPHGPQHTIVTFEEGNASRERAVFAIHITAMAKTSKSPGQSGGSITWAENKHRRNTGAVVAFGAPIIKGRLQLKP